MFHLYVDGSYDPKKNRYSWAFAVVDPRYGTVIHRERGVGQNADASAIRNVAGELSATMRGARWCLMNGYPDIVIYHDYEGVGKWISGEWQAKNLFVQEYRRYMTLLQQYGLRFSFQHVRGHSKFNELVDKMARAALS